jgi:hypothetical protein
VLDALNEARVETLLIADGFRARGAATRRRRCSTRGEGPRQGEPVADIVEPAIEKALEQSRRGAAHHATTTTSARSAASAPCCVLSARRVLGTGIMGAPMARNLARPATRCAPGTARASARAARRDGVGRRRRREAVAGAEVVVTMLADGDAVDAVDGRR